MNIAGIAEISKPPTGGILFRNTFKYGSVTKKKQERTSEAVRMVALLEKGLIKHYEVDQCWLGSELYLHIMRETLSIYGDKQAEVTSRLTCYNWFQYRKLLHHLREP